MRSVADELREETRRRTAALSPAARIRLALELGDDDVTSLSHAQGRRLGRRPSRAHDG